MKRKLKFFLCLTISLCMVIGVFPLVALATELVADYDAADPGDVLYTVDFRGTDGIYDLTETISMASAGVASTNADGSVLTFSNKPAAVDFYGGTLKDFPITDRVYTVRYFLKNTDLTHIRAGVQIYIDRGSRLGIVNADANSSNQASETVFSLYVNGTVANNLSSVYSPSTNTEIGSCSRLIDAEGRQEFMAVVDGVNYICSHYAKNADGNFQFLGFTRISPDITRNYLTIGLMQWDSTTVEGVDKPISLGPVTIEKGVHIKTAYETLYDNTVYGASLFDISFPKNTTEAEVFGNYRPATLLTETAYSADGTSLTLDYGSAATQCLGTYLPNAEELIAYGDFTYEFHVESAERVGVDVMAWKNNGITWGYGMGFTYWNNGSANTDQFHNMGTFNGNNITATDARFRATTQTFVNNDKPALTVNGESVGVNVKIEVDVHARTVTNYLLKADGTWEKTARITYHFLHSVPIFCVTAYNASTNAVIKNLSIKKGLTAEGPQKYVQFKVDGRVVTGYYAASAATLPQPPTKPYFISYLALADDDENTEVIAIDPATLNTGYNTVALKTVYTPVPVPTGLEIRGIQHSTMPDTVNNVTSVRFIGALDNLNYSQVGFLITAKWKDASGAVHVGTKTVDKGTPTVYTSIRVTTNSGYQVVTAADLGVQYLVAVVIDGVPIGDAVQVDFTITPYSVPIGETPAADQSNYTRYITQTFSFVNGVYENAASPLTVNP